MKRVKMRNVKRVTAFAALLVLFRSASPRTAYAYLDPGTGSYIIQILIAALAGGTYMVVASWGKIKTFLRSIISKFSTNRKDEKNK